MGRLPPGQILEVGGWLVEPDLCRISHRGSTLHLRPRLMDLLVFLASNQGRVLSKDEILEQVWPQQFVVESVLGRSIADLRELLGDDAASPRFIETFARRGYRLIANVRWNIASATAATGPSIVVLPFADLSPEGGHEYFCDGLTEELTNTLSSVPGLRVIARTSAFSFRGRSVDVREIGRCLGVGSAIEGSVQRSDGRLRITVQLVATRDGSHLWSRRFDLPLGDIFAIQDEVARSTLTALEVTLLGKDQPGSGRGRTSDPEAFDLFLRGRYVCTRRTPEALAQAARYFEQAIARDPGYALAHASLGECFGVSGTLGYLAPHETFPRAMSAARRALELEPALAEAHASLASCDTWYGWRWAEAERGFTKAIELSPSYALAHMWYSHLLAAVGRPDEALEQVQVAQKLDPMSLNVRVTLGMRLSEAGRVNAAIEQCMTVVAIEPAFPLAHLHLGRTFLVHGRCKEAVHHLKKIASRFPLATGLLGRAFGCLGRYAEARRVLAGLHSLAASRFVGAIPFALVHQGLGEIERALEWFGRAFDAREGIVSMFGVDPIVDDLRPDARFAALLQRLQLPPAGHPSQV